MRGGPRSLGTRRWFQSRQSLRALNLLLVIVVTEGVGPGSGLCLWGHGWRDGLWFRALAALPEELGSSPAPTSKLTTICNSILGVWHPLWPPWALRVCGTQTCELKTPIYIKNNNTKKLHFFPLKRKQDLLAWIVFLEEFLWQPTVHYDTCLCLLSPIFSPLLLISVIKYHSSCLTQII